MYQKIGCHYIVWHGPRLGIGEQLESAKKNQCFSHPLEWLNTVFCLGNSHCLILFNPSTTVFLFLPPLCLFSFFPLKQPFPFLLKRWTGVSTTVKVNNQAYELLMECRTFFSGNPSWFPYLKHSVAGLHSYSLFVCVCACMRMNLERSSAVWWTCFLLLWLMQMQSLHSVLHLILNYVHPGL